MQEFEPDELKFLKDIGWYEDDSSFDDLFDYSIDLERISEMYLDDPPLSYYDLISELHNNDVDSIIFQKKRIIGLKLSLARDDIPSSIKNLKKLKILVLDGTGVLEKNLNIDDTFAKIAPLSNLRYFYVINSRMREIPNLTKMFPKLICLYLGGTHLKSTPKWLFEFAQKHDARRYTRKGVVKEDAEVLGLLNKIYGCLFCYEGGREFGGYSINDSGHVVELKLGYWYWHGPSIDVIPYFPEEISRLQHLERLYVYVGAYNECWEAFVPFKEDKGDVWIPESISKLKSLRYLCTNAKYSEMLLLYLKSLETFQRDMYEGETCDFFTREGCDYFYFFLK